MARQAVVLVHGIGQQRPMDTLSGYIQGLREEHDLVFAAPSPVSEYRDVRRVKVTWVPKITDTAPNGISAEVTCLPPDATDFYELYWANLVTGSTFRHVTSWLAKVIRHPARIGPRMWRFILHNFFPAVLMLGLGILAVWLGFRLNETWSTVVGATIIPLATYWMVWSLGDVPRYIHNVADNVAIQRAVRREGVELLKRLHQLTYRGGAKKPMYDRIVVIGHSLGSVVAYDIVRDYWIDASDYYGTSSTSDDDAVRAAVAVEDEGELLWSCGGGSAEEVNPDGDPGFTRFQRKQRELAAHLPDLSSAPPSRDGADSVPARWAVTDLVTLACPLTHADLLLADGASALTEAQWDRALPTCPPRRQTNRPSYRHRYRTGPRKGVESWHQAAFFAFTRWTNIYYQSDIVGGPLRALFGPGITDLELPRPRGVRGWFPLVHGMYNRDPLALSILRRILWDGGRREDGSGTHCLQRRSLEQALEEIRTLPVDRQAELVKSAPLLRRFRSEERAALLVLIDKLADKSDEEIKQLVDEAVQEVPTLVTRMIIVSDFLQQDLSASASSLDLEEMPELQEIWQPTPDGSEGKEPEGWAEPEEPEDATEPEEKEEQEEE